MKLETNRLFLQKFALPHFEAILAQDNVLLGKILALEVNEGWTHFPEAMPFFENSIKENPNNVWVSYFICHKANKTLIGTCGYVSAPDEFGNIEIGYEIRDNYQGLGFASEAAEALVNFAFSQSEVKAIFAHTIALDNSSTSVLKKLGFRFLETMEHPEDGLVYKWKLSH